LRDEDSIVHVEHSDVTYPVIDGIVDFCRRAADTVSTAYDAIASRYDTYMRSSNVFMKVCNTVIWGFRNDLNYDDTVLSYLPCQFDGVLLDVAVGTGVFTCSRYAAFPNATIIAIDYSMAMLQQAKNCFRQHGREWA